MRASTLRRRSSSLRGRELGLHRAAKLRRQASRVASSAAASNRSRAATKRAWCCARGDVQPDGAGTARSRPASPAMRRRLGPPLFPQAAAALEPRPTFSICRSRPRPDIPRPRLEVVVGQPHHRRPVARRLQVERVRSPMCCGPGTACRRDRETRGSRRRTPSTRCRTRGAA
jgi:hypothetical protein